MIEFTKEELKMIVDALQFTGCADVCTDIKLVRSKSMCELSAKISETIEYVSEDNYVIDDMLKEEQVNYDIIKSYIKTKK